MSDHAVPFHLRAARLDDDAAVAALCEALARHEGSGNATLSPATFRQDGFGPDPAFSCLIAERDGRPVGYALHLGDYDTDLMCRSTYLADLYVDIAARRCGIGRALMAAVAHVTQAKGGRTLHWNVLRHNGEARAFYSRLGREVTGSVLCSVEGAGLARLASRPAPADLLLRRAAPGDVPAVARLLERLLAHEGFDPSSLDLVGRLAADGFGDGPAFTCDLAERGGAVVGYTLHWPTYDTEPGSRGVYLSDVYVAAEARRGGVARALMGAVARHCVDHGAAYLEWEVRHENAPARAFYATVAEEFPDVVPMTAAGERFAALAALGATLPGRPAFNR